MMFKDKYIHKFYAFALAAVFALTLAGCGGGGGGGTAEQPMTGPTDAERIAAAQTAATTAAGVAAAALAAVEANQSADLDSYIRASIANDNAQAALEAANAATTPAAAEAAQADAEAASADVQKYAGMVTAAHNAIEAAKMELMALNDARAAAMKAYMDAKAALDAIAGQEDADSASYGMAVDALAAALVANDAAQAAETSADAEAAQADAEAALADAMKYAGMVTAAHMEATALSTAQQAAMQAYMDAKAALMAAEADKDYDIASYTRAEDAVADAKAASDAAAAATTSADAQAAQADAEAARDAADGFIAMIATAKSDREEMERMAAAKKAANKVALSKETAINTEGDPTTTLTRPFDLAAAPVDPDAPTATENYVVSVKHTGSAVEVEVTDGALARKNDPKFMYDGEENVRTIGDETEVVVVDSTINAPKATPFSMVYVEGTGTGEFTYADTDTDVTGNESLVVTTAIASKIKGFSVSTEGGGTVELNVDDASTTDTNEAQTQRGSLDGAPGVYSCGGTTDCEITIDAEGKVSAVAAGQLLFTPDEGATVDVPDSDYLVYGFWVKKTVEDGVTTYNAVQTFHSAPGHIPANVTDVEGTATYEGEAVGVYAHKTFNAQGTEVDVVSAGTFTADVELTAKFGGGNVAANDEDSISGSVSNFDLSGDADGISWKVNLNRGVATGGGPANNITPATGVITGDTQGMTGSVAGSVITGGWSGQIWSKGATGDTPAGADINVAVSGEFNANFVNGTVAGAFGADKQ